MIFVFVGQDNQIRLYVFSRDGRQREAFESVKTLDGIRKIGVNIYNTTGMRLESKAGLSQPPQPHGTSRDPTAGDFLGELFCHFSTSNSAGISSARRTIGCRLRPTGDSSFLRQLH